MSFLGSCIICTDYFDAENDISVTPCGHLFHALCLNQWIETSPKKTCPQCRMAITPKRVVPKIFVNIPEENTEGLDPYALKNKLDEADGLLKKCNAEKNDLHSSLRAMESTKDKLMNKMKKLKSEMHNDQNTINLLKSDIDALKTEVSQTKMLKEDVKRLKIRLQTLEKVEVCLNGQKGEVDEMLAKYSQASSSKEAKQLATFCVAMKQEYETLKESRSKLSNEVMKLKRDLHRSNAQLLNKQSAIGDMEKTAATLQQSEAVLLKENQSLQQKIKKLQLAITSPTDTRTSAINRLISESPAPEYLTPVNGIPVRKMKQLHSSFSNNSIKKPCLSFSLDSTDVDLNDSCNIVEQATKIPLFVPETPDDEKPRSKMHHTAQKENLMIKNVPVGRKIEENSKIVNPMSIRNKLLTSKLSSSHSIGYDGLGGCKKIKLQKSSIISSDKFSSVHTSAFKEASAKKLMSNQNRFNRLKRVYPS